MENMSPYLIPGIRREQKNVPKRFEITVENIIAVVCLETGIPWEIISGPRGKTKVSNAKQIMCYFLYTYCNMNKKMVGKKMNQDHTTIIHSLRKFDNYYKTENDFREIVDKISSVITS